MGNLYRRKMGYHGNILLKTDGGEGGGVGGGGEAETDSLI